MFVLWKYFSCFFFALIDILIFAFQGYAYEISEIAECLNIVGSHDGGSYLKVILLIFGFIRLI